MRTLYIAALAALITVACAKDPSKDAPAAQVGEKVEAAAAEKAPEAPEEAPAADKAPEAAPEEPKKPTARRVVDLTGTIGFVGSKVTASQEGIFKDWSGGILIGDSLEAAKLNFEVQTASVFSNFDDRKEWSEKLDKHLRSADFFDSEQFPKASFSSTRIAPQADGKSTHIITGDLTMKDIKRSVSFPATMALTDKEFSAQAEFSINRKDWGIVYPGKPDDLIRDGVVLKIDLKGVR